MDWFTQVGGELDDRAQENWVKCNSWEEALHECQTNHWESIVSSSSNIMYAYILDLPDGQIAKYETFHPLFSKIVGEIADRAQLFVGLPQDRIIPIRTRITWDIAHYLYSCEFIEYFEHSFPFRLGESYLQGRFPCGWRGVFPYGQLVVY